MKHHPISKLDSRGRIHPGLASYSFKPLPFRGLALWLLGLIAWPMDHAPGQTTFTKATQDPVVEPSQFSWGGSWADYDLDGSIDLFVANFDGPNSLFRNRGDGTFERVLADNPIVTDSNSTVCGVWGDFDNDGDPDLFLSNWESPSQDRLYRNDGAGAFTDITDAALPADSSHGTSAAWVDFDGDGFLDISVANGSRLSAERDSLYRNVEGNGFEAVVNSITESADYSEVIVWGDFDHDGDPDAFVTSQFLPARPNRLYRNDGILGFSRLTSADVGSFIDIAKSSLGAAWGDFNNDGNLDLVETTGALTSGSLLDTLIHINGAEARFNDSIVLGNHGGVACVWGDFDNDGYLDLFMTSNDLAPKTNHYYHNMGDGSFVRVENGAIATEALDANGAAAGDLNNDGFLDLFIANLRYAAGGPFPEKDSLFINDGNENHWIIVRLDGTKSNRSGIGVKVRIRATIEGETFWQMREISGGDSLYSQNDTRAHFGLGDAETIETIRIEWPSGIVHELHDVAADQILTVTEAPSLTITPALILTWPIAAEGYLLESAPSVDGPWTVVEATPSVEGDRTQVTVPAADAMRLFRLRTP